MPEGRSQLHDGLWNGSIVIASIGAISLPWIILSPKYGFFMTDDFVKAGGVDGSLSFLTLYDLGVLFVAYLLWKKKGA